MAGIDGGLSPLAESAHHLANHLVSGQKAAEGMTGALFRSALVLKGMDQVVRFIGDTVKQTEIGKVFAEYMSIESLNLTKLKEKQATAQGEELRLIENKIEFAKKLHGWGTAQVALGSLALASATNLWFKQREFNQDLIEANSSFEHRNELLNQTLVTQAQIGIGFQKATEAAKALVHYGLDTESTYSDNVKLVVQMEQGLGISVNNSAQLASIVEHRLKGSFKDVADTLATIVENTALAGDEAAKLAHSIGDAMGRLGFGRGTGAMAGGLSEVTGLVGKYESELKRLTGQSGGFQQLIEHLTKPEGMTGQGALNVTPDFIKSARGTQMMIDNFQKFGTMITNYGDVRARLMGLQQLSELTGVSLDQAEAMIEAVKNVNAGQDIAISLQDRWRNQIHATNQGITRLGNSLLSLIQGALSPFVNLVGAATNAMADGVEWLLQNEDVVAGVFIAIGVGFVAVIGSLVRLTAALWQTFMGSNVATAAIARYNLARIAQNIPVPGMGLLSRFGLYGGALTGIGATVGTGLVVAGIAGLGYALWKIYDIEKKSLEEQQKANQVNTAKYNELQDKTEDKIYRLARYGGSDDEMEKQVGLLMQHIRVENEGDADVLKAKIAEAEAIVANIQDRAKTSLALSGVLDREGIDQGENQLVEWARKTHAIAEEAKKVDEKRLQWQKEQAQEDEKRDARIELYNLDIGPFMRKGSMQGWGGRFTPVF